MVFIVLPQALRAVIPAIVGQFIALFMDTTLAAIVGLVELFAVGRTVLNSNPDWLLLDKRSLCLSRPSFGSLPFPCPMPAAGWRQPSVWVRARGVTQDERRPVGSMGSALA